MGGSTEGGPLYSKQRLGLIRRCPPSCAKESKHQNANSRYEGTRRMIETAIVKERGEPDNVLRYRRRSACVYTFVSMDLRLENLGL